MSLDLLSSNHLIRIPYEGPNEIIDSEKYEAFCADWVKREMDEETWRKMNEQEKQKFLLVMVKNAPWRVLKDKSPLKIENFDFS